VVATLREICTGKMFDGIELVVEPDGVWVKCFALSSLQRGKSLQWPRETVVVFV
jgi:hypothetical protein